MANHTSCADCNDRLCPGPNHDPAPRRDKPWIDLDGIAPGAASREVLRRARRALDVYESVCNVDITFYGKTGGDLAYLMAAILRGNRIELSGRSRLWGILVERYGKPADAKPGTDAEAVWRCVEKKP